MIRLPGGVCDADMVHCNTFFLSGSTRIHRIEYGYMAAFGTEVV